MKKKYKKFKNSIEEESKTLKIKKKFKYKKNKKKIIKYYKNLTLFLFSFIFLIIIILLFISKKIIKKDIIKTDVIKKDIIKEDIIKKNITKEDIIKEDIIKKNITKEDIIIKDSFNEVLEKGKDYTKMCIEDKLVHDTTSLFKDIDNPMISVIIPVYNANNSIKYAIRSAQNQKFTNIEIILVNDYSQDNSLEIMEEMQKEDKRLKIINNNKNMGVLYSRSIAALNAKGKYIFPLDNDDMFLVNDIFDIIYNEAERENYDIISFTSIDSPSYDLNKLSAKENEFTWTREGNVIVHQPELGIFPINKNNQYFLYDPHIWGKCIKADIYKMAVNALGESRYSVYNCWNEDITMFFIICNFAQNYIFVKKYGIFHFISRKTASFSQSGFNLMNTEINLIEIILDFAQNNYKKYAALKALHMRHSWLYKVSDEKIKSHLKEVLQKVIDCNYIEEKYKNKIRNNYEEILGLNNFNI